MKVRSQSALPAIMMVVAIFAAILSAARVFQLSRWNSLLREGFEPSGAAYDPASPDVFAGAPAPDFEDIEGGVFTLERSLSYYDRPGGAAVLTLEPGEYLAAGFSEDAENVYGERSLPASDGWRCVRPFVKSGEEPGERLYVKTADLLRAIEAVLPDGEPADCTIGGENGAARAMTPAERTLLANDIALYDAGIYCSSDIEVGIFEARTVFTGVAGLALICWSIILFRFGGREKAA